jgi:hypothetical protein
MHLGRIRSKLRLVLEYLQTFNYFQSISSSTAANKIRTHINTTRIYIVALLVSFIVLLVYTSTATVTERFIVNVPNLEQYSQLYTKHVLTLRCPCTRIVTNYKEFAQINFTLHQVCFSAFVTEPWLEYMDRSYNSIAIFSEDCRVFSPFMFQALNSLCKLINDTIVNILTRFYNTSYVGEAATLADISQA